MWHIFPRGDYIGNRVLETRFISLINKNKSERNHQNIREEPREKRKKKKKTEIERERRSRSELVALNHSARPRQTQAVRDLGLGLACDLSLGRPRPRERQAARDLGLGLACLGHCGLGLPGSLRLESFSPSDLSLSLPLIWVFRIGIDVFGIS